MEGIFRNLRGLDGKERKGSLGKWGLGKEVKVVVEEEEEEKRKRMESAVRKRSGKVVVGLGVMCIWCGGGGGGGADMTIMMLVLCCGAQDLEAEPHILDLERERERLATAMEVELKEMLNDLNYLKKSLSNPSNLASSIHKVLGNRLFPSDSFVLLYFLFPTIRFDGDVCKRGDAIWVVESSVKPFGRLDILVNAATSNLLMI
ncbi:hypothetical protein H0E87_026363 [Populus deltoides]|uniref:Uncharacterized protein n=1 Tax=Populus deltoides TaxID=3696 RepID=A0A8T2X6Y4_POPDE|nr:hypothetical protein H0E87_026363 [Populus deltoides]